MAIALEPVLGAVEVSLPSRLTGGASRETWSVDATDAAGVCHELVLRRDPPGRPSPPGAMAREAAAIAAADANGVPVPEVLVHTDGTDAWETAGMVMRRVQGETIARRILRDERFASARSKLVAQCARALAGIHAAPADVLGTSADADPLGSLRELADAIDDPVPTFEVAFHWLDRHRPEATGLTLVHGDFRLGNLMVDESGLVAVLDWELVHGGDPVEDLGWLCVRAWRFGADRPVAGLGEREELLGAYRDAGGARVGLDTLRWWEVYGTLRWGLICQMQASAHLSGAFRSVELAAIGRRVAETEWDLLLLIDPDRAASHAERELPTGPDPGDLHGRPSAAELVEAVREFLSDQVVSRTSGSLSYGARVAANALAIVERELRLAPEQLVRRRQRLESLGVGSERELAAALREGRTDPTAAPVLEVVGEGVLDRLLVANPRYIGLR